MGAVDTTAHGRTMSPLNRARKPGFSPDASECSALVTFVIIALYKSTFTIPYHIGPFKNRPTATDEKTRKVFSVFLL